jgi:hypothetical protein
VRFFKIFTQDIHAVKFPIRSEKPWWVHPNTNWVTTSHKSFFTEVHAKPHECYSVGVHARRGVRAPSKSTRVARRTWGRFIRPFPIDESGKDLVTYFNTENFTDSEVTDERNGHRIWGSHTDGYKQFYLLGYRSVKLLQVFASTVIPGFRSRRDPWARFFSLLDM